MIDPNASAFPRAFQEAVGMTKRELFILVLRLSCFDAEEAIEEADLLIAAINKPKETV